MSRTLWPRLSHSDSYNSTGQLSLELREATMVTTMKALEMTMRPWSRVRLTEN